MIVSDLKRLESVRYYKWKKKAIQISEMTESFL